eukprot:SAG11_NODE_1741_length_4336_cov_1.517583_9_plen_49_part_00
MEGSVPQVEDQDVSRIRTQFRRVDPEGRGSISIRDRSLELGSAALPSS